MTLKFRCFDPHEPEDEEEGETDNCPEIEAIFKFSPHVRTVIVETTADRILHPDKPWGYTFVYTVES